MDILSSAPPLLILEGHIRRPLNDRCAFTLIEMLIVIGIIGILLAILLPAINAAKRNARYVECGTRLRTIGQACHTYAANHKNVLPLAGRLVAPPDTDPNNYPAGLFDMDRRRYTWANVPSGSAISAAVVPFTAALGPELGFPQPAADDWHLTDRWLNEKEGVWRYFRCPDTESYDKAGVVGDTNNNWQDQGTMIICNIGGSTAMGWASNGDYAANEGVLGYHYDTQYNRTRLRGKLNIRRASEVMLFSDAIPRKTGADPQLPNNGWITWTPKLDAAGAVTLGDALAGNGKADSAQNFDLRRHGKRINILFADGHVEGFPIDQGLDRVYLVEP